MLSRIQLFVTPWTIAHHAPLPMGFCRQEYWNGLPFPLDPGIEPIPCVSLVVGGFFTNETLGKSKVESYVLFGQHSEVFELGRLEFLGCSKGLLQEGKQGSKIYRSFCNKDQVAEALKITVD